MAAEVTHMICAGATKAGTSWLHAYLRRHPECWLRSIKELHYFNTLHHQSFDDQITARREELDRLGERDAGPRIARRQADLRDWIAVLEQRGADLGAYLSYLTAGRALQRVVGDMTPAYGLLPVEMLRKIARMAADVRIVYLLRDPVDRLWSQIRMNARRRASDPAKYERKARNLMEAALAGGEERAVIRGDYAGALTRLDAAVDPQRLLVLFQEELFSKAGLAKLTRFLGIAPMAADTERRVHQGDALALDPVQRARAAAFLRPQYEFVAARFGSLPPSWEHSLQAGATA